MIGVPIKTRRADREIGVPGVPTARLRLVHPTFSGETKKFLDYYLLTTMYL